MFEETQKHLSNEISVVGDTVLSTPGAVFHEIMDDWHNHKKDLAVRTVTSGAIGLGTGIALAKLPGLSRVGAVGMAGLAVYGFYKGVSSLGSLAVDAWDANSEEQRQRLVNGSLSQIGRIGATSLETTVGFGLGGGAGVILSNRVAAVEGLSTGIARGFSRASDGVARGLTAASDRFLIGPGTERLPVSLLAEDNSINVLALSDELAKRHPWEGMEISRSVRTADMKAGPALSGAETTVNRFAPRAGRIDFHTHPPVLQTDSYAVPGARPSLKDVVSTDDTGVIRSGTATTMYKGAHLDFLDLTRPFVPKLNAVVVDPTKQVAVQLENAWNPDTKAWAPAVPRLLDFDATIKVMSRWKSDWREISAIPGARFDQLHQNPHWLSFLKLGVYDPVAY